MTVAETTILVVDDEEAIKNLLQDILEDAGYRTVTAANGFEALNKLSEVNVSLVLLDIAMLTGKREVTSLQHAMELGADDFIRKPFRVQELLARIAAKLRRANMLSF
jgi:DNA-binding response OmpR family regulator